MSPALSSVVHEGLTSEAIIAGALASAPRNALLRHHLFRRVYLVCFLLFSLCVLLPAWAIFHIPRSNRPRASWTIQRCLRVRWSRNLCALVASCEIDYLGRDLNIDLQPQGLSHSHPVTIPPAPTHFLLGHAKETLDALHASQGKWDPHLLHRPNREIPEVWGRWNPVEPREYGFAPVKAFWFDGKKSKPEQERRPRQPSQAVMLHFHGGGYLCGTAAETDLTSSIPKSIVIHSPIHHVLSVDYRLAPEAPWPLPLLDAISAYHYLTQIEGVDEKDIVIAGDSAGGHLAIALTRWLRDNGRKVDLRGARGLVLLSPWVDVGFTNAWGDGMTYNADCDTIDDTFGPFATSLLLRALPAHMMHTSSYLSPASYLIPATATGPDSLASFPPTIVISGGAERLAISIKTFWNRLQLARKVEKLQPDRMDRLVESPDCPHDFMIFPWMSEEAGSMYELIDDWLRELLSSDCKTRDYADSPLSTASDVVNAPLGAKRRSTLERSKLRAEKSPVLAPRRHGVLEMVEDMRIEGVSMIGIPISSPDAMEEPPWLAPFTARWEDDDHLDDPEWTWFELGTTSPSPEDSDEDSERY